MSSMDRGLPASQATAALQVMVWLWHQQDVLLNLLIGSGALT
jgi:hypothetical protein